MACPWRWPGARRIEARSLYWRGWSIAQIAEELALPVSTLSSWKQRQRWDAASPRARAEECLWVRYQALLAKEQKTGSDFKEIDLLGRQFVTFARIGKFSGEEGNEADLNPARSKGARTTNAKKEQAKNLITPDMVAALRADMHGLFGHQETWLSTTHLRTRMIVKSRQIGATWYFARERLLVALETGKNQIFLSASRAQANIFRAYIVQWVQKVCGVMLKGDPIVIQRGEGEDGAPLDPVELYFLGTNYRTAQGYHGDVVIDECFWIYGFEELFKVAAAMATHKIYTRTLFSTPSTLAHEAYPMWSGDRFNRRRARRQGADRHRHEALREGALGPTASGARSSPCSTRWRRASTSSMSRNCNANMRSTSSTTCSAACSSTTARACSPSRSCAAAWSTAGTPGAMSSPMPRSPTRARSGSAMTPMRARTARATMPRWWRSPRPSGRAEIPHPRKEAPQGPPVRPAGRRDPRDGRALSRQPHRHRRDRRGQGGRADRAQVVPAGHRHHLFAADQEPDGAQGQERDHRRASGVRRGLDGRDERLHGHPPRDHQARHHLCRGPRRGVGHADLAWAVMHALFFEPLDASEGIGGRSTMEIFDV
jgi:uncharacterized protein YjcR